MKMLFGRVWLVGLVFICAAAIAQDGQPAQGAPPASAQQTAPQQPNQPQPASQPAPTSQSAPTSQPQAGSDQQGEAQPSQTQPDLDAGGFVFKKQVEEVVLHAIVVDRENHLVTKLDRENFQVFEDGKPQTITSFHRENVPVALGIVVDNSGSMRPKRAKLAEAALTLVEGSQEQDKVFVVNFDDEPYLDQDFTGNVAQLRAALERTGTRGTTALYDAMVASAQHLEHGAPQQKKILLVITDGQDNASRETFADALEKLENKAGPVIYAIVLRRDGGGAVQNGEPIRKICENTGGTAFFPDSLDEVRSVAETIANDIRSQYVIEYKAPDSDQPHKYRAISVQASDRAGDQLRVSTRTGYYSGSAPN
jgi:Ca-activated chloride channel homolog